MSDLPGLPPGWTWATLGELAVSVRNGVFVSRPAASPPGMRILRISSVRPNALDHEDVRYASPKPARAEDYVVERGDLLFTRYSGNPAYVGACAAVGPMPGPTLHPDKLIRVVVDERLIDPRFVQYAVNGGFSRREIERRLKTTAGQVGIAGSQLRTVPIPVAPRGEQERIVVAIEEHLSRLDAADGALLSALHRLRIMRASGLDVLTHGDWPVRPLGEVLVSLRNGCFVSRPKAEPPGLPILRISAVRPLELDVTDIRYGPTNLERAVDFQVEEGDLLFTRYSGNPDYVGACAIVPREGAGLLHPDKLIRGVPDSALVRSHWVALVLTATIGRREIEKRLKTTAGQVGIAGSQLKSVPIPLPPLKEQTDRIAQWNHMLDSMHRLRSEVELATRRTDQARRSLLAAAFSGQLVPQDPSDEPASALLDRIRADRAVAPTKRTRKVKTS